MASAPPQRSRFKRVAFTGLKLFAYLTAIIASRITGGISP